MSRPPNSNSSPKSTAPLSVSLSTVRNVVGSTRPTHVDLLTPSVVVDLVTRTIRSTLPSVARVGQLDDESDATRRTQQVRRLSIVVDVSHRHVRRRRRPSNLLRRRRLQRDVSCSRPTAGNARATTVRPTQLCSRRREGRSGGRLGTGGTRRRPFPVGGESCIVRCSVSAGQQMMLMYIRTSR